MDPEEADLFYVPLYASCYRSVVTGGRKLKASDPRRQLQPLKWALKFGPTNAALVQYLYSAIDYIRDVDTPYVPCHVLCSVSLAMPLVVRRAGVQCTT